MMLGWDDDDLVLANQRLLRRNQTLSMLAVYASALCARVNAANSAAAVHTLQQAVEFKELEKAVKDAFQ